MGADSRPRSRAFGAGLALVGLTAAIAAFLPWVRWHLPWLQGQLIPPGEVLPVISSPVDARGVDHFLGLLALAGGVLVVAGAIGMLLASATRWSRVVGVIGGAAALSAGLIGILDASEVLEGSDRAQAAALDLGGGVGAWPAEAPENPVEELVRRAEEASDQFQEVAAGEGRLAQFNRNHPEQDFTPGGIRPLIGPYVAAAAGFVATLAGLGMMLARRRTRPVADRVGVTERPAAPLR
jgi:hypothetical protein